MHTLHEVQGAFSAAVFTNDAAILTAIRSHGLSAERRLAIYRNNTFLSLVEALRDRFPVVHRLVGDGLFDAMARQFVAACPLWSACLLSFGGEFPGFIETLEAAASLPYLSDVACLEWACHESFHADDARCFGLAELAALSPESYASLSLHLHPSVRWLDSAWPVLRIFSVNQPGYTDDPVIDLDKEGGCRLLLVREGCEVKIHELTPGEQAFLCELEHTGELEAAFHAAKTHEPEAEPTVILTRLLELKVFYHPFH